MGEKNGRRANLIKQRRYDLVPGYTKGVQKKYVHLMYTRVYSILQKNPNSDFFVLSDLSISGNCLALDTNLGGKEQSEWWELGRKTKIGIG